MPWVEANAFPGPGKARNPAANGFKDVECSATSFQYLRSKRRSTLQEKPTISSPSVSFSEVFFPPSSCYYVTTAKKIITMVRKVV
jgi:hypothetical protein